MKAGRTAVVAVVVFSMVAVVAVQGRPPGSPPVNLLPPPALSTPSSPTESRKPQAPPSTLSVLPPPPALSTPSSTGSRKSQAPPSTLSVLPPPPAPSTPSSPTGSVTKSQIPPAPLSVLPPPPASKLPAPSTNSETSPLTSPASSTPPLTVKSKAVLPLLPALTKTASESAAPPSVKSAVDGASVSTSAGENLLPPQPPPLTLTASPQLPNSPPLLKSTNFKPPPLPTTALATSSAENDEVEAGEDEPLPPTGLVKSPGESPAPSAPLPVPPPPPTAPSTPKASSLTSPTSSLPPSKSSTLTVQPSNALPPLYTSTKAVATSAPPPALPTRALAPQPAAVASVPSSLEADEVEDEPSTKEAS